MMKNNCYDRLLKVFEAGHEVGCMAYRDGGVREWREKAGLKIKAVRSEDGIESLQIVGTLDLYSPQP